MDIDVKEKLIFVCVEFIPLSILMDFLSLLKLASVYRDSIPLSIPVDFLTTTDFFEQGIPSHSKHIHTIFSDI